MISYCLKVAPHYSGQLSGHFPDFPGLVVLGRDHEEVAGLALQALEEELEHQLAENGRIPEPQTRGRLIVSTTRFG